MRSLRKKATRLRSVAKRLQAEHDELLSREVVLSRAMEGLEWLQREEQQPGEQPRPPPPLQHEPRPQQPEAQELAEGATAGEPGNDRCSGGVERPGQRPPAAAPPPLATAAPEDDPLWLTRWLLAMGPVPGLPPVKQLTQEQLLARVRVIVRELALDLTHHEAKLAACYEPDVSEESPLERMHMRMGWLLKIFSDLAAEGRNDLLWGLTVTNWDTGAALPGPPLERHKWVVTKLGLQPAQRQRLARGVPVFCSLLESVQQDLRDLQQGRQAPAPLGLASTGPLRSTSWVAGGSLERQQQRQHRMGVLLLKDSHCRLCLGSFLYGCMSWQQIAKVLVLMSPFMPAPMGLITAVMPVPSSTPAQPRSTTSLSDDEQDAAGGA